MSKEAVRQVMELYPRIYFACHTRHVRDPKTKRLLSAHQASILDHLDEYEPLTLLDLAEHMGVTPSTMSLHMERLVRRGYVLRERDAKDGRRLKLRISPAGVRVRRARTPEPEPGTLPCTSADPPTALPATFGPSGAAVRRLTNPTDCRPSRRRHREEERGLFPRP